MRTMRKNLAIFTIFAIVLLIAACAPAKVSKTVSVRFVGEDGTIFLEEKDVKITGTGEEAPNYINALVYVLEKNGIAYELNDDKESIKSVFGYEQYFNEPSVDSSAYWRMFVNSKTLIDKPSDFKLSDGDIIECVWTEFDRHQYCDHN